MERLRSRFGLEPVAYPATSKLGASKEERSADLIAAFEDPEIKAVITTLGGDDQITYVKNLPDAPFRDNPKPFFGYSDNTHFANHLWLNGVPSFYGGCLFVQIAEMPDIDPTTEKYLRLALFDEGETELDASMQFNEELVPWEDPGVFKKEKNWEPSEGWSWNGESDAAGITWGGCLESLDEIMRHGVRMPSLEQFEEIVLLTETSEEAPTAEFVHRVLRAFGERGILERVRAVLVGRPMAWTFEATLSREARADYRRRQREVTLSTVRRYNPHVPVVQNIDFGHTMPQICLPYGARIEVKSTQKKISVKF
jgi:muramoyltetrapeptide carboxypeptidase LdcA involved in peptidoglycan recycling